jgi:hypothetical protein
MAKSQEEQVQDRIKDLEKAVEKLVKISMAKDRQILRLQSLLETHGKRISTLVSRVTTISSSISRL